MTITSIDILALAIGISSLLVVIALIIYILRWKTAFVLDNGDQRFQLVPDNVITINTNELEKHRKASAQLREFQTDLAQQALASHNEIARAVISSIDESRKDQLKVYEAHQMTLEATKSLQEEFKILRSEIQTQAAELERHRKGYDVDILSAALIPMARVHRMIKQDLNRLGLSADARITLEALEDEHLEVLETRGVKLVEPLVGALYRDQRNIKHPPETISSENPSDWGTIKIVKSPAYEMETTARKVVLLEAEVVVYSAPQNSAEEEVRDESVGKEEEQHG